MKVNFSRLEIARASQKRSSGVSGNRLFFFFIIIVLDSDTHTHTERKKHQEMGSLLVSRKYTSSSFLGEEGGSKEKRQLDEQAAAQTAHNKINIINRRLFFFYPYIHNRSIYGKKKEHVPPKFPAWCHF